MKKITMKIGRILAALSVVLTGLFWKISALASDEYYPTDDEGILIVVVFGGALIIIIAVVISVVSSVVSKKCFRESGFSQKAEPAFVYKSEERWRNRQNGARRA